MATTNFNIGQADGWVKVVDDSTSSANYIRISGFPYTHPFYVYSHATVAPTATTVGVAVSYGEIEIESPQNADSYWVRVPNPLPGGGPGNGDKMRIDVERVLAKPLVVGGSGSTSSVSLTRPNDTAVYAANDVLGAATGSTAALSFTIPGLPTTGGDVMITGTNLEVDLAAIPAGMTSFTLQLYSATPPSALGDNAAWDLPSGDRTSYLGSVSLGAPADLGATLYVEQNGINKQVSLPTNVLFAYLVTVGTYTPAANTVYPIKVHTVLL